MKNRYYAKEVKGKGYIFDRAFSEKVPIAVEKSITFAQSQVNKFNKESAAPAKIKPKLKETK